jgi:hypothetical protein
MSFKSITKRISQEQFFVSILFCERRNYVYNLLLGRILGPTQLVDAAI